MVDNNPLPPCQPFLFLSSEYNANGSKFCWNGKSRVALVCGDIIIDWLHTQKKQEE